MSAPQTAPTEPQSAPTEPQTAPTEPQTAPSELIAVLGALADETRWAILAEVGRADASASALAGRLPVSRQAIAKHLAVLEHSGLVESRRVGRELRYRAIGAQLSQTARALDRIGAEWDRRLAALKRALEGA